MRWDWLERRISRLFHNYGILLARRPLPFILLPVLSTLALCTGFLHIQPVTDAIYLFTPRNSPSKMERLSIHQKWPLTDGTYIPGRSVTQAREIQVTALARDGGNILDHEYAAAVYRLDMFIQNRVKVRFNDKLYGYKELCLHYRGACPGNKHVHLVSDLYAHGLNVTFPTVRLGSESGYLGSSLGGVSLTDRNPSHVVDARAWFLLYQLKFYPKNESFISGLWEIELGRAMKEYPKDPFITTTYFHSQTLTEELKRNADTLIPRFVVSFGLLVVFSALCSFSFLDSFFTVDWVLSKPILSVLGVINAGMGILSGVGLLLLFSVPYNDIVAVMPFLVVAVGVDNMFLMVASVRRTSRSLPVEERMAECMSEAAVSILITATTDAFSFGVGTITSIPAVQIFCMYTCCAITLTFIYQITFFAAFLGVFTRIEAEGRNSVFLCLTKPSHEKKALTSYQKLMNLGSRPRLPALSESTSAANVTLPITTLFFRNWFAPVLMHPVVRALTFIWYIIYLSIASYGFTQLKEGLEPINLLVKDSYAIPHYHILQDYFWKYGALLQIVVNNAPDLREKWQRERTLALVNDMASTRHSVGPESVQFWMNEMGNYYHDLLDMEIVDNAFYGMLQHFLSARPTPWSEDVLWERNATDNEPQVSAFRFLIGMRDISSTTSQQRATEGFREVASRYPEYNVTTFMPLWLFTDQYAIVLPNTLQNIAIALICMIIIALLLIPQPSCALWVALACASIDFGVVGYMTLWGVKLDAISMITIIMSIGFSVDYSAHITYGYVVSTHSDPKDKINEALSALGWPLFQGALSTIIAVSVLSDVPAYMIVTFFKTVFLAITFGILHGLLFLPVFLSVFVRGCCIKETGNESINTHKVAPTKTPEIPSPILEDLKSHARSSSFSPDKTE